MARIGFYHLIRQNLDQALPKLLDKAIQSGARVVVLAGSSERITELDERLWVYEDESWLPHGRAGDANADLQPIWLTDAEENPNNANILVACDGARPAAPEAWERVLDLFDGNDPEAVAAARDRWREWKQAGHDLVYYQQGERGGWEEKARSGE